MTKNMVYFERTTAKYLRQHKDVLHYLYTIGDGTFTSRDLQTNTNIKDVYAVISIIRRLTNDKVISRKYDGRINHYSVSHTAQQWIKNEIACKEEWDAVC